MTATSEITKIEQELLPALASSLDASVMKNIISYTEHLKAALQDSSLDAPEKIYWQEQSGQLAELLADPNRKSQVIDAFYTDLEFGTGGMRGILGPGSNRVNLFTIGKATQGFGRWLQDENPQIRSLSVVIAHDSRHLSRELAEKSVLILAALGIKCYLFQDVAPTPLLSFAVRHLQAQGGIVLTASHNPPAYNGYKVYRADGCQVPPPKDKDIIRYVSSAGNYQALSRQDALDRGFLVMLDREIDREYILALEAIRLYREPGTMRVGFSPLHGTGGRLVPDILRKFKAAEVFVVPSQIEPDGNFPTVDYPNPEEPRALAALIELGKEKKLDLILANDPDADRVGIGVRKGDDFVLLNGNQTGAILEYYVLSRRRDQKRIPANGVVIKTIVTTELQSRIAADFGVRVINTLTGFKFIGDWMYRFDQDQSGTYLFGGEESYGYLMETFVRDKDGLSACYFVTEAANYFAKQGMSLLDVLEKIYQTYGLFVDDLFTESFPGKSGMDTMKEIMDTTRRKLPARIGEFEVISVYDLQLQQRINILSNETIADSSLPISNVIQFELDGGGKMTVRPSGTEPKIKFYFSIPMDMPVGKSSQELLPLVKKQIQEMMQDFQEKIIKPVIDTRKN